MMKKLLGLLLVIGLAAFAMSGCQSSTSSTPSIPDATVASSVGMATGMSTAVDNAVRSAANILSVGTPRVLGTYTAPTYSGGWWTTTLNTSASAYSYDASVNFRLWSKSGSTLTEAVNQTQLDALTSANLDQMYVYATYTMTYGSSTFTMAMGGAKTDAGCLKITDILSGTPIMNGPISISGTSGSDSYTVTITYLNMTTVSGLPSGTATFSVVSGGSTVASGNITYSVSGSTCTATINFSGGGTVTQIISAF